MNAKQYLKQNRHLKSICNSLIDQIAELRALLTSVKSTMGGGERIQSSIKVYDKTAEIICDIAVLEEKLKDRLQELLNIKKNIIKKINLLDNDEHILLLNLYYLNYKTFEDISEEMKYSKQWILTLHKKALRNFEKTHFEKKPFNQEEFEKTHWSV